jgi:arsenate reductase
VITLYGIKNCDTVKKARRWLEDHAIEYQFHDFRDDGMGAADVKEWVAELGWETVVTNAAQPGSNWRKAYRRIWTGTSRKPQFWNILP